MVKTILTKSLQGALMPSNNYDIILHQCIILFSLDFKKKSSLIAFSIDGWMTSDFTSYLTVFQSYQHHVWVIIEGCVQWNTVYD